MSLSVRLVCLLAWMEVAVRHTINLATASAHVVVFGVDVIHQSLDIRLHQTVLVALGLCLAISAWVFRGWSKALVVASSALFLVSWFPWRSVGKYGIIQTFRVIWVIDTTPDFSLAYFVRDAVLPVAFVTCIALVVLEMRRSRMSTSHVDQSNAG